MTAVYLERKLAGLCVRCGALACEASVLCEQHRADAAARVKRSANAVRAERRAADCCAFCGVPSATYRCLRCADRARGE